MSICLGRREFIAGLGSAASWPLVERLFARLRLRTALLDRRPDQVSGGELQRVALVRALLCRPRFIFADEPSPRLDLIAQHGLMQLLGEVAHTEGIGILLVSHERVLVGATCTRVHAIGEGRIGEPAQNG